MNKIILADNQAIFRASIAKVLASEEDFRVAAQCADLERLLLSVDAYRSSIVLFASALRAIAISRPGRPPYSAPEPREKNE